MAGAGGLALLISLALVLVGPRAYEATVRLAVSVGSVDPVAGPPEAAPYAYYREYYLWLASEYLADDLSEIIQSDAMAAEVSALLNEEIAREQIRDVLRVRKTHRILDVTVYASRRDQAERIARGIAEVIQKKGHTFLAQLASQNGKVVLIDEPQPRRSTTTGSVAADLALRLMLGLFAGCLLAFLADYLDSTVRSAREVETTLGLPILGEIPAIGR